MTHCADRRRTAIVLSILLLWVSVPENAWSKKGKKRRAETVEDLQVVDCLLPPQIRKLGRRSTFTTPRRPVRTSAVDCEIRGGEYTAYDRASYATALEVWLPSAQAGDPVAQTYVGEIFEKGLAQTPDYEAAAAWYEKAADQGHTRAQINLGNLYEKGLGVELDPDAALQWYRRAAGLSEAVVLDWTEQEVTLRRETEELRQALESTRSELDRAQTELEKAQAEAADLRRRLEEARKSEAGRAQEVEALAARLEESESRAESIRQSIRDYRDELTRLAARESSETDVAGPTITIVEPSVLATRGPAIVPVEGGASTVRITGRVTAPAGLRELSVDGDEHPVDDDGFFRLEVAATAPVTIRIEALDERGQRTRTDVVVEPGARRPPTPVEVPPPPPRPRRPSPDLHALILSVADYDHLPDLQTVRADTAEVERVLAEKYGFQTTVLEDPTHFQILAALNEMAQRLEEKDHLLIYYAGHGKLRDGKGYWIGVDGAEDDPSRWLPNEAISDQLDVMKARHVMVVSDSCYSGTLSRSGVARVEAGILDKVDEMRSRTVLTSGGLRPVLDEGGGKFSIFAQAFLRVIELNEDLLAGTRLHREVAARVRFAARALGFSQKPEYVPIRYAGHEAGDFTLLPRSGA